MQMEMYLGLGIGVVLAGFVAAVVAVARAGSVDRAFWGLTIAGRANMDPAFEAKVRALLGEAVPVPQPPPAAPPPASTAPAKPAAPPKPTGEPLRVLALLQAEARLVDFLMEDIAKATDAQVGQAVRDIHKKAQAALKGHMTFEPVLGGTEGENVTVPVGFDPSAVRVVGNVTGQPPFTGELLHAGWRVKDVKLPTPADGQDLFVVQPAEVQLG